MEIKYTDEKHVQILIALLKVNNIKKIVASPGTTNITFVRSLQNDPFFELFSVVDERSAAYMACGLAAESGEVVVLSCTGATASRNYMPGLTEAFYRKLPVLAVTSTQDTSKVGHHFAQVIDRSQMPKDTVKLSVEVPVIHEGMNTWSTEITINKAILELTRNGGGPVHINLATEYNRSFSTDKLPNVRVIKRIEHYEDHPQLPKGRIAILIGSHPKMTNEQTDIIDKFCDLTGAVVFCDHTSGYKGKHRVLHSLFSSQRMSTHNELKPKLIIHIGEITGDYSANKIVGESVWRVNSDGELRDTFGKVEYIFQMSELAFFSYYIANSKSYSKQEDYFDLCSKELSDLRDRIPEIPFSNLWIAQQAHKKIPENSTIHFAILNSLRSWNFFELHDSIISSSNVGGFGIDGCLSSLIGASLFNKDKLYFGVIGDLSFFYDLNSLGNKNIGNNLRVMLINNGTGVEFRNFNHFAAQFGESADEYIAAGRHFGNKSKSLVKNYAESLGFQYISAGSKDEFERSYGEFFDCRHKDKPIIFEVFTDASDESKALEIITSMSTSTKVVMKNRVKDIVGAKNINKIKKLIKR